MLLHLSLDLYDISNTWHFDNFELGPFSVVFDMLFQNLSPIYPIAISKYLRLTVENFRRFLTKSDIWHGPFTGTSDSKFDDILSFSSSFEHNLSDFATTSPNYPL